MASAAPGSCQIDRLQDGIEQKWAMTSPIKIRAITLCLLEAFMKGVIEDSMIITQECHSWFGTVNIILLNRQATNTAASDQRFANKLDLVIFPKTIM